MVHRSWGPNWEKLLHSVVRHWFAQINQIKCSFNTTIVKPQLYNTRQDKATQSITVTEQHLKYKITISDAARKLPIV